MRHFFYWDLTKVNFHGESNDIFSEERGKAAKTLSCLYSLKINDPKLLLFSS